MQTDTAPLRVTLVIGSNRHGRFGPVVADWLLDRLRDRDDLVVDVVDVAEADLPMSMAPTPSPSPSPRNSPRRTRSSSSPPSTTTATRPA